MLVVRDEQTARGERGLSEVPVPAEHWAAPPEAVLDRLGSSPDGLSAADAGARLDRCGPNDLPRGEQPGLLDLLVRQVRQPLFYVLLVAAALAALLGEWVDAGVIVAVVVANVGIGLLQEHRATREVQALLDLVAHECDVVRGGERVRVPSTEVVPGDVLLVRAGQKIPADARVIEERGLTVDEAVLTGESMPVEKLPGEVLGAETLVADRTNTIHAGTIVAAGSGAAVVVATGAATELARIAELVEGAEEIATPLTRQMASLSKTISVAILAVAALTFGIALAWGFDSGDALLAAVALAVAAIPEGLPAVMTIALALGVRRMAQRHAVMRRLPAVETLGSTTVVCSDKTGTLTAGEMVVTELFAGTPVSVSGVGYAPAGEFTIDGQRAEGPPQSAREALEAFLLCSDADLASAGGVPAIHGAPTEGALVVAAAKAGLHRAAAEERRPRLAELPFDSDRKYMATLHDAGETRELIVKGAPEAVLQRCSSVAWQRELDAAAVHDAIDAMAAHGLRALAVAGKTIDGAADIADGDLAGGFRLLGIAGLLDPPREEAIPAVESCRRAGIRVVMITGDHPRTAAAIAERLGITENGEAVAGGELEHTPDEALREIVQRVDVFARTSPEHKLRIVRALQARGEVVAVTGDGVNDAPALKQADIGVAMGVSGTDVSKEAADMVLRDDNFVTIARAVEEGRRVYDNLVKSIVFVLPTSAGQALLILGALAVGLTLPVLPVQVLWVNLITAVGLALPLAVEAREPDVMRRPPRAPGRPVLDRAIGTRILLVGVFMLVAAVAVFEIERGAGRPIEEARTAVVGLVMLIQVAYLFSCRALRTSIREVGWLSNPWVYAGVAVVLALQMAFTYLPVMNTLFHSAPLPAEDWLRMVVTAALVVPVVALHKRLTTRR